jgi:hypothetical protein
MQLWRKATSAVWASNISWAQKLYLNMCARCAQRLCCRMTPPPLSFFFGTRLFATHIVSFVLYCTLVPIAVIAPEIRMPFWALIYVPIAITISTTFFTPGGWKYTVAYVLYENAMCVVKLNAMLSGLFELSNAHEWCGLALHARAQSLTCTQGGDHQARQLGREQGKELHGQGFHCRRRRDALRHAAAAPQDLQDRAAGRLPLPHRSLLRNLCPF